MRKNTERDETFSKKIYYFLAANNWVIVIGILFTFFYLSIKVGAVLDNVKQNEIAIKKDIGKVIFITSDGRILTLNKQKVSFSDKRVMNYIANILQYDLIQDLVSISKGFKVQYSTGKELANKYTPFADFKKYLLNKKWIEQYAQNILFLISNDNYPEYIHPYNRIIKKFVIIDPKTNKFKIEIQYQVIKRSYLRELTTPNKYKTEYANINMSAIGIFNVAKYGSLDNPFGLKFINIETNILTKR